MDDDDSVPDTPDAARAEYDDDADIEAAAQEMRRLFGDGPMELWAYP